MPKSSHVARGTRENIFCTEAAVTTAIATDKEEANRGDKEFVLQPVNDSIMFQIFTKEASEIPGKSVLLRS